MSPKLFKFNSDYCATIDGPWYDDSNPEGFDKDPQIAQNKAWEQLLEYQKEINEFVAKGQPTFNLV